MAPDYPGFGLSRAADGYDFRPRSHSQVVEALVDRLGLEGIVVFGYAWGGPIGLGLAGRRPELVRGLVIANTWAWPDDRLRVRLFSALMGGPLSPLLVDRLNLMLRLYLPLNLKRGRLSDAERAAYEGPFPPGKRSVMRVFPREIVRGRAYLREVEANLPKIAGKPAHHRLAGFRSGVRRRGARALAVALPGAPRRSSSTADRPVHRRGRARGRRRGARGVAGGGPAGSGVGRRPAAFLEHVERRSSASVSTSSPPT